MPVVYAVAMAVEAVSALATGLAYDRVGRRVLLVLPVMVAAVPLLALDPRLGWVLAGRGRLGRGGRVQDSTVKALVADLVPSGRLATAYGVFAAFQGAAALAGGALAGWLYGGGVRDLVVVVALCQAVSLVLLVRVLRRRRTASAPDSAVPALLVAERPRAPCTVEVTERRSGDTVARARIIRAGTTSTKAMVLTVKTVTNDMAGSSSVKWSGARSCSDEDSAPARWHLLSNVPTKRRSKPSRPPRPVTDSPVRMAP